MTRSQQFLFLSSASAFITPSRLKLKTDTFNRGKPNSLLRLSPGAFQDTLYCWQGVQFIDSDRNSTPRVSAGSSHAFTPAVALTSQHQCFPEPKASPGAKRAQVRRQLDNISPVQR